MCGSIDFESQNSHQIETDVGSATLEDTEEHECFCLFSHIMTFW